MKKTFIGILLAALLCVTLVGCGSGDDGHSHSYSAEWTSDETYHWHIATCEHTSEISGKAMHNFSDGECTVCGRAENNGSSDDNTATQGYTVTFVCDDNVTVFVYDTQNMSGAGSETTTAYSRGSETGALLKDGNGQVNFKLVFKDGYKLAKIDITEGYNNLKGSADTGVENGYRITKITADLTVTVTSQAESAEEDLAQGYEVTFVCNDHVKVIVYETQDYSLDGEETNIAYSRDSGTGTLLKDGNGQVNFKVVCDDGYEVLTKNIVIDGAYNNNKSQGNDIYRITKIESDLTVTITATEKEVDSDYNAYKKAQELGVSITYESGTENCFTVKNNVITFGTVSEASVYNISGELTGQIVIDVGDNCEFTLSMQGLTVTSDSDCPIVILSGDKVTLSVKNGTENCIYDKRSSVLDDDSEYSSAIYSVVALNLQGKGSLKVVSDNNKGIHTKDDLSVKNLTLYVKCVDNALKGNDSITISSGALTLIATGGDCIKTSNSGLSSKGNQKGTVTISGGTVALYAACDGIDAAYDVEIGGDNTVLNIYTDKYSDYTGDVAQSSTAEMYVITSTNSSSYRYAVYFYNSDDDYEWQNSSYYGAVRNGRTTYYAYKLDRPTKYSNFKVYRFLSSQTANSTDTYNAATSGATVNTNYNALVITVSSTTINGDWANLSTSGSSGNTYSMKGIKADNEIGISGGAITIESTDDCIHCDYGTALENGETGAGIVTISGGTITVSSLDDAVHSDYKLYVNGGIINVTSSYEGLEANLIYISGGQVYVKATDDGINAGGKITTPCITISGGYVDVTVGAGDCDGIDSNGNFVQTGGFVISRDPTAMTGGMASGLDIDGTCTITGGTFICAGAIGQTPSSSSKCWVKFGSSSSGGWGGPSSSSSVTFTAGTYTVTDSNDNELFTFILDRSYTGMWIASDCFSTGNTYTITNGTTTKHWTQSSNSVTVS